MQTWLISLQFVFQTSVSDISPFQLPQWGRRLPFCKVPNPVSLQNGFFFPTKWQGRQGSSNALQNGCAQPPLAWANWANFYQHVFFGPKKTEPFCHVLLLCHLLCHFHVSLLELETNKFLAEKRLSLNLVQNADAILHKRSVYKLADNIAKELPHHFVG